MEQNEIEVLVIPEVPKVVPGQETYVYVPLAKYDSPGIASFNKTYFSITDGLVSFSKNTIDTFNKIPIIEINTKDALKKAENAVSTANEANERSKEASEAVDSLKDKVDNNAENIQKILNNESIISTGEGGFKAGKNINVNVDGIGIGNDINASQIGNVSIGKNIDNNSTKSVIIGSDVNSLDGDSNVLIGANSSVQGDNNIAIGKSVSGKGESVVIGGAAKAERNSIAIGNAANAAVADSVQIGTGTNNDTGTIQYKDKRIIDSDGNLYENNVPLKDIYLKRTFIENLYLVRTGDKTAVMSPDKPTASDANYLSMNVDGQTIDFGSAEKITVTRVLEADVQLDKSDALNVILSYALNKSSDIEFGARAYIDNVLIASQQAFGLRNVNGDSSFKNVMEAVFDVNTDAIIGSQEFLAGQTLKVEIVVRHVGGQDLAMRYFCGVNISGVERNSSIGIKSVNTTINTGHIKDGAVTTNKISDNAVTDDKLSDSVKDKFAQANVQGTSSELLENIKVGDKIYNLPSIQMSVSDVEYDESLPIVTLILDGDKYRFIARTAKINTIEFTGQYDALKQKGVFDNNEIFTKILPKAINLSATATIQGSYHLITVPEQIDTSKPFTGLTLKGFLWSFDGNMGTGYVEIYNDGYAVKGTYPAQDLTEGITDFKVIIQYIE